MGRCSRCQSDMPLGGACGPCCREVHGLPESDRRPYRQSYRVGHTILVETRWQALGRMLLGRTVAPYRGQKVGEL